MSPRASTASEKVESTESGEDGVVWGSTVGKVALANAVAFVLDLVIGVMTDDR